MTKSSVMTRGSTVPDGLRLATVNQGVRLCMLCVRPAVMSVMETILEVLLLHPLQQVQYAELSHPLQLNHRPQEKPLQGWSLLGQLIEEIQDQQTKRTVQI